MEEMKKKNVKKKTVGREILEWILTIVAAVAIALPLRAFAFEMVRVEGSSMNGTLSSGEIMFVTKFDYASTWLSLPWWDDKGKEAASRITTGGDPKRFDVVVCRYPGRGDTNFVKRVVGLPGDIVEVRQGYLYVNGERYEEPYILDEYRGGRGNNYGPYEAASESPAFKAIAASADKWIKDFGVDGFSPASRRCARELSFTTAPSIS